MQGHSIFLRITRNVLISIVLISLISGCATTKTIYKRTPDGDVRSSSQSQYSPGFKRFIILIGAAIFAGVVVVTAPKEAY